MEKKKDVAGEKNKERREEVLVEKSTKKKEKKSRQEGEDAQGKKGKYQKALGLK